MSAPTVLKDRRHARQPLISLVLYDWGATNPTALFRALARQQFPRDRFEVVWIDWGDDRHSSLLDPAAHGVNSDAVDRWIALNRPEASLCRRAVLLNAGILAAAGEIITLLDLPTLVTPRFVGSIADAFLGGPHRVVHLDSVRVGDVTGVAQTPEQVLERAENWNGTTTEGLADSIDPWRTRDYGVCISATRDDLLDVQGVDEIGASLGIHALHELTWRLGNLGCEEMWLPREYVFRCGYRTEHCPALSPKDSRRPSGVARDVRRSGRTMPIEPSRVWTLEGTWPERLAAGLALGPAAPDINQDDAPLRLLWEGRVSAAGGRHEDALRRWSSVPAEVVDRFWLTEFGWARYHVAAYDQAQRDFEAVLREEPTSADARRGLAAVLLARADHAAASTEFTQALASTSDLDRDARQECLRGAGWARYHLADFGAALVHFTHAIEETAPHNVGATQDAYRGLGWSCARLGRLDEAERWFEQALASLKDSPDGEAAGNARQGLLEVEALRQAIPQPLADAVNPPATPEALPRVPADPGAVRRKKTAAGPTLPSRPSRLRSDLGWAFMKAGHHEPAARAFRDALRLDEANLEAWCGLGCASGPLGQHRTAWRALNRAIDRRRHLTVALALQAYRARAWLAYREGQYAAAVDDFSRALSRAESAGNAKLVTNVRLGRCRAYLAMGDRIRAAADLAKVEARMRPSGIRLHAGVIAARLRTRLVRRAPTRSS